MKTETREHVFEQGRICPLCASHKPHVGMTWTDSNGRTWEVFERMSFGMFKVRTTDLSRLGEMSGRAIIAHLENKAA